MTNTNPQTGTKAMRFQDHLEKQGSVTFTCFTSKSRPANLFTLRELSDKYPKWKYTSAVVLRSDDDAFPHPQALLMPTVDRGGAMTYLYEESMFLAYVRKKSVRKADERLLERARKLEAEAGRIRYQLKKNQKFQITFTEGDK